MPHLYLSLTDKAEGLLTRSNSQSAPAKPSTAAATASEGVEPMQVDSAHQPAASETTTSTASQVGKTFVYIMYSVCF